MQREVSGVETRCGRRHGDELRQRYRGAIGKFKSPNRTVEYIASARDHDPQTLISAPLQIERGAHAAIHWGHPLAPGKVDIRQHKTRAEFNRFAGQYSGIQVGLQR